ncbi:glycosyltransferase family 2 protein [Pseudomonas alabamensis]|uniref:glycosyltransferase family 2 protein n=1 Tax=Pseudomonas alabamensis TaxID=3064349 RepID=UPI000745B933|nr:glycosyl transferase [Pseudomonas monteilii]
MDIFHRYQQANEHEAAAAVLERALQVPAYRPEALVWKGIAALPQTPKLAFLFFAEAAQALPERADVHALVGRSLLAQGNPALATRYLTHAWKTQPNDLALRLTLWEARSQSETPAELRRMILAHLPDIHGGKELGVVLKLLAAQANAPSTVGVVRYVPEHKEIQGWAINLRDLQTPVALQIDVEGNRVNMVANAIHPLLKAAGLPDTNGGIRIRAPNPTPAVHVRFVDGTPLLGSPLYAMPAFVPPAPAATRGGKKGSVDVLIPVYDGLEETLECINSALEARKLNRTPHRLVVIEDKTPVSALAKALKVLAAKGKITLVQNQVNLGFIRSMNRAMALSPTRDVVWLNADTRVHGAWLDRLHAVAYSANDIASVTPFTNNGELMSFPRSRFSHPMPNAVEHAQLDDLARQVASLPVDIETGCGFCLYIKREAIEQTGYLDEIYLSRGYGEETDWCLRARILGWRHVGAPNVFVAHQGGISFGAEKTLRVAHNNAVLRKRYPEASARYQDFCQRDPIKPARDALQRARLAKLGQSTDVGQSKTWPTQGSRTLYLGRSLSDDDCSLRLSWQHDSHRSWVTLQAPISALSLTLDYEMPHDFTDLVESLRLLPLEELVFEQLDHCPVELCGLPALLNKPYHILRCDSRLSSQENSYDWQRFAREATSINRFWNALKEHDVTVLSNSYLSAATTLAANTLLGDSPRVLLIGDSLQDADLSHQWLVLARRIARECISLILVAKDDKPWLKALCATGVVHLLPKLDELTFAETVKAIGCDVVVSLTEKPDNNWLAISLAIELGLPLDARPISTNEEVDTMAATHLPLY